jgi:predicted transport protein
VLYHFLILSLIKKQTSSVSKVDPTTIFLEPGFTCNVTNIGHYGTGDLEIRINNDEDLEKAKYFIEKSYDIS